MKEQMAHWWRVRPLQSQMPLGCKRVPVNRTPLPATVARLANTSLLPALYAFVRCRSSSRVIRIPQLVRRESGANPLSFFMDLDRFARLVDQWRERLKTFPSIDDSSIGTIGGGKSKPSGRIDIALIQSLVRNGEVNDLVGDYGHLMVDECHHLSAVTTML